MKHIRCTSMQSHVREVTREAPMLQKKQLPQPSSPYHTEGESLLRNLVQSGICMCNLLLCTQYTNKYRPYLHSDREGKSQQPSFPPPRCDSHLALHQQPVFGTVSSTTGAAVAFFNKEPPWWQPDEELAIGNVIRCKMLQYKLWD